MNKITFVIFDLDDTLLKSNINYRKIKIDLIKLIGETKIYNKINPDEITINELLQDINQQYSEKFVQARDIVNNHELRASLSAEILPFANKIPEILRKNNIGSAILTNNSAETVKTYLENIKFNYLQHFGKIYTRDDIKEMKPNPTGILTILRDFALEKEKAVYIGDSHIDCLASMRAGIKFILLNSRKLSLKAFNCKPWKIIENLEEFQSILN